MRIIIIGAGLAGVTASICLAKKGHSVKVIERKEKLWAIGGAINLTAGAIAVFKTLDMQDKVTYISDETDLVYQRDLTSGAELRSAPLAGHGSIPRTTLRPNLLKLLFEEASRLGVAFVFSATVVGVHETSDSATAVLEDGNVEMADLIVAAEGVRSRMRKMILRSVITDPATIEPVHSDRIYYVTKFAGEQLKALAGCSILLKPEYLNFWMGNDDRYVLSLYNPIAGHLTVNFCLHEPSSMTSLWDEDGDINYLRGKFVGKCHPELERALLATDHCERWRLSQLPDLPHWRSPAGRMILLGDAAHAMYPTAGHGYSSTVEEIAVLSYVLEKGPKNMAKAMGLWEDICKPRSNRVKAFANFLSRQYEGDEEALMEAAKGRGREEELRKTDYHMEEVELNMNAGFADPEFTAWLRRYDVVSTAKEHVEKSGGQC